MITDIACIKDDGDGARMFRQQSGVDIPEGNSWDNSRCKNRVPDVRRTPRVTTKVMVCASVRTRTKVDRTVEVWHDTLQ